MNIYPNERYALFIDGANLYATSRSLGFDIDYKRFLTYFSSKGHFIRALYYTALLDDQDYSPIRPLIDWLDYNGYAVKTKPAKEFTDAAGRRKVKGNMDIELAIDALVMAENLDHIVIFSGDGDFRHLVDVLQRRGKRVTIVSTISVQPAMIADELRRQADEFIDLANLRKEIGRPDSGRNDNNRGGRVDPAAIPPTSKAAENDLDDEEEYDDDDYDDEEYEDENDD